MSYTTFKEAKFNLWCKLKGITPPPCIQCRHFEIVNKRDNRFTCHYPQKGGYSICRKHDKWSKMEKPIDVDEIAEMIIKCNQPVL